MNEIFCLWSNRLTSLSPAYISAVNYSQHCVSFSPYRITFYLLQNSVSTCQDLFNSVFWRACSSHRNGISSINTIKIFSVILHHLKSGSLGFRTKISGDLTCEKLLICMWIVWHCSWVPFSNHYMWISHSPFSSHLLTWIVGGSAAETSPKTKSHDLFLIHHSLINNNNTVNKN